LPPRQMQNQRHQQEKLMKNYSAECSGGKSVPSVADVPSPSKASRTNRMFITSELLLVVFGRQLTAARTGRRSLIKNRHPPSGQSASRLLITTLSTQGAVRRRFGGTSLTATEFINLSTAARLGKTLA